jgi:hypothetical protein
LDQLENKYKKLMNEYSNLKVHAENQKEELRKNKATIRKLKGRIAMNQEIKFTIGTHLIWFDQGWHCGSHEIDAARFNSLQEAVNYAVWVLQNPGLHAKEYQ